MMPPLSPDKLMCRYVLCTIMGRDIPLSAADIDNLAAEVNRFLGDLEARELNLHLDGITFKVLSSEEDIRSGRLIFDVIEEPAS